MNLRLISSIAALVFFALLLTLERGHRYGTAVLVLATLFALVVKWKQLSFSREIAAITLSFLGMALVVFLNSGHLSTDISTYEHALKYLLGVGILVFLYNFPARTEFIWWGVALGAVGTGIVASYYTWVEPIYRASPYHNPIQYGNYSVLLACFCLCGVSLNKKLLNITLILGVIFGVLAALLSQSRGSWLALVIFITFFIGSHAFNRGISKKNMLFALGLILSSTLILKISFGDIIQQRVMTAVHNVVSYYKDGPNDSSSGLRLQMWEFGIHQGLDYPVLGSGKLQLEEDKKVWIEEGKASPYILNFGHLHNEFINTFSERGFIGLFTLLFLLIAPVYSVWKISRKSSRGPSSENKFKESVASEKLKLAVFANSILFASFGLAEVSIRIYSSAFLLCILSICFFYTAYLYERRKEA